MSRNGVPSVPDSEELFADPFTRTVEAASVPPSVPQDPSRDVFPLDRPLMWLSPDDAWTIRDACEGIQVFGATGSGKSSGVGANLALSMLTAGFGGLVLTSKREEAALWADYCARAGRADSLIVVTLNSGHGFDFLRYECNRPGGGPRGAEILVPLLLSVVRAAEQDHGDSRSAGQAADPYWQRALAELLLHTVELASFTAGRELSLDFLTQIVFAAPRSLARVRAPRWREVMAHAERYATTPTLQRNLYNLQDYFNLDFPQLPQKTRASITSMFTSTFAQLRHGRFGEMFASGKVTVVPELTHEGAVIVLDIPINEHAQAARSAQLIFKYLWQQATARRQGGDEVRPVFLWSDESQDLVSAYDAQFQAKARSARACTVYLTQNLPGYVERMGESSAHSLLGNLQTKVFHANGDEQTNSWAERLLGHETKQRGSRSETIGKDSSHVTPTITVGTSEAREPRVEAADFTMLKKGGWGIVEALVFQPGRVWKASGENYMRVRFRQGGA